MTRGAPLETACERYERLALRAIDGDRLASEERRFLREHEAACATCGALAEIERAVAFSSSDPPCAPLDDLTAQRLIVQTLDGVREAEAAPRADPAQATARSRPWRWILAGGGAAVAAALLLLLWASAPGHRAVRPTRTPESAPRVLLVSGSVETARGSVPLGEALQQGDQLSVRNGRLGLRLAPGILLLASPMTSLRLVRNGDGAATVHLSAGELLGVVAPGSGAPRLRVLLPEGAVTITGTIFAVRRLTAVTHVDVLRGHVLVAWQGQDARQVTAGRSLAHGEQSAKAVPRARARRWWREASALDLLTWKQAARVVLRSDPPGASVTVDGISLGRTPLEVALKPGHRALELRLEGRAPLREHLRLKAGITFSRDFDLAPSVKADSGGPHDPAVSSGAGWRTLLSRARKRRAARDWHGAAQAYAELVRRFPGRPEASVALVALGTLQLEHLDQPGAALSSFRRYLAGARQGALAREALWGQARALRRLGRHRDEIRALRQLLRRPGRANRADARQRLQTLRARQAGDAR